MTKQALIVLGMHRSGTSAFTRLLSLLGAALPSRLMKPVAGVNEAGFWEPVDLVGLNDEILAAGGSFWDDIFEFPPSWYGSSAAGPFREQAVEALRRDFARHPRFVLKDPRMCRLMPFWLDVLESFGAEPYFLIPIRNPLAVAASLKTRNGFLPAKSHLLWLRHLVDAERHTREHRRCFLTYEDLLEDWRGATSRLAGELGLDWPRRSHHSEMEIERFLSENLKHHTYTAEDVDEHEEVPDSVRQAYRAALAAAKGDGDAAALSELADTLHAELEGAGRIFGTLVAEGRFLALDNEKLRRRLAEHENLGRALVRQHREIERLGSDLATLNGQTVLLNQRVLVLDEQNKSTRREVEYWHDKWQEREGDLRQLEQEHARLDEMHSALQETFDRLTADHAKLGAEASRVEQELGDVSAHARRLEQKVDAFRKIPFAERIWRLLGRGGG